MPATSLEHVIGQDFARIHGREAWRNNLTLARMAAGRMKSSLGPMGAFKLVTYNRGPELVVKVTKDPVDVLEELGVEFAGVRVISEAAKLHREELGDGVTSFLVFFAALLDGADRMMAIGIHPLTVLRGYREAVKKSHEIIDAIASDLNEASYDPILRTVDCGRDMLTPELRPLLIEAAKLAIRNGKVDKSKVRIAKKSGGNVEQSELVRGIIIEKEKAHASMPDILEEPRVAVITMQMDVKHFEPKMKGEGRFPMKLVITKMHQLSAFKAEELRMKLRMVEKLKALGVNVVMTRSLMADEVKDALAREGILGLFSLTQEDIEAAADATGAKIVGNVDELTSSDLGRADRVWVEKIDGRESVTMTGGKGVTLLLRGSLPEKVRELEKAITSGIRVLSRAMGGDKLVPGGAAATAHIAGALRRHALSFDGKEQIAIESFAEALEEIPECLARNYGLDVVDTMTRLRSLHSNGGSSIGVSEGGCTDMKSGDVVELASTHKAFLRRAYEVASLMLRIDDFITIKEFPKVHKQ